MSQNNMEELYNRLFKTMDKLENDATPIEIEKAIAITNISKVIIEAAKTEIMYIKALSGDELEAKSKFMKKNYPLIGSTEAQKSN